MALEGLRTQIDALQWEKEALKIENRKLKEKNPDRAIELEQMSQYPQELEASVVEIETLPGQLKMIPTLEAQLGQSMQEVESLKRQLEALQNGQSEVVATATEQLRLELHSLEVQVQQAQSASREAEAVVEKLQGRIESLSECNSDLQSQCERLERQSREREENVRHRMEFQQLKMLDETNRKCEAREERLLHQLRALEAKQQATPASVSHKSEYHAKPQRW